MSLGVKIMGDVGATGRQGNWTVKKGTGAEDEKEKMFSFEGIATAG